MLCVLTDPHKIGGGRSCFMLLGCIEAKPLWSETPGWPQMWHNTLTSLEDQGLLSWTADFVLHSPESCISGWVVIFHFRGICYFPPPVARSTGLAEEALVPEDTASRSLLCTHGVGWEEQDSSFSTFKDKYSLSKPLSHSYLSLSGSMFWSPHLDGPG